MLTHEQITELKDQLKQQVQGLPEEQKAEAMEQIDSMSSQALEEMVKQQQSQQSKIFRKIVNKEIPSKIIFESAEALAILEIRPISEGHAIIIPKKAVTDGKNIAPGLLDLSKMLADKLSKALGCKKVEILSANQLGEIIVNLIPVYDKEVNINSPRKEASDQDLEKIKKKILDYKEPVKPKEPELPVKKVRKRKPRPKKIARRIP